MGLRTVESCGVGGTLEGIEKFFEEKEPERILHGYGNRVVSFRGREIVEGQL